MPPLSSRSRQRASSSLRFGDTVTPEKSRPGESLPARFGALPSKPEARFLWPGRWPRGSEADLTGADLSFRRRPSSEPRRRASRRASDGFRGRSPHDMRRRGRRAGAMRSKAASFSAKAGSSVPAASSAMDRPWSSSSRDRDASSKWAASQPFTYNPSTDAARLRRSACQRSAAL